MRYFSWDAQKNEWLKNNRGITFEEIVLNIEQGHVIDVVIHPDQYKYPDQRIFVLNINSYVYLVPFVEDKQEIFLKTIIPSRKATRIYLKGE